MRAVRRVALGFCLTVAAPVHGADAPEKEPPPVVAAEPVAQNPVPFGEPPADDSGFPWRKAGSVAIVGGVYGTAWTWVSAAWWTRKAASKGFIFLDEGAFGLDTYAGGSDKLGHYYANYLMNRGFAGILEWGGFTRTGSIVWSTLLTTAFFSAVEVKDAYHFNYGFSASDVIANLSGQGTALALMLVPELDRAVSVKIQYFPSNDFFHALSTDGPLNTPEDYSGQTFLLAYHLASLSLVQESPGLRLLRYLDLSLGWGTRNYKPVPPTPVPVRQHLTVGVSINFQSAFDDLFWPEGTAGSTGGQVVHFVNEVYQPPYTRIPFFTWERVGPPTKAH
jgi:hypothetical protein